MQSACGCWEGCSAAPQPTLAHVYARMHACVRTRMQAHARTHSIAGPPRTRAHLPVRPTRLHMHARACSRPPPPNPLLLLPRRSVKSPYKLVSTFPAPDDDVRTMHDNLDKSIGRFPHVRVPLPWRRASTAVQALLLGEAWMFAALKPHAQQPPLVLHPLNSQVPFLGTRKRDEKGKLGPYTWMTYAQVREE